MAITLASTMTDMYEHEANRQKAINEILWNFLSIPLHLSSFSPAGIGPYQTDGTSGTKNKTFINVEIKNEIDTSSGDPFMQNIAHYHNFLQERQKTIHNHHHPWLLIECVGNLMAISAAVMGPNRTICAQPLSDYIRFSTLGSFGKKQAHFCMSLRLGIKALAEWYSKHSHKVDAQAGFPFVRKVQIDNIFHEIKYQRVLGDATKPVFLAKLNSDKGSRDVVVKFVDENQLRPSNYGVKAHCRSHP